jgi:hypothetical protein
MVSRRLLLGVCTATVIAVALLGARGSQFPLPGLFGVVPLLILAAGIAFESVAVTWFALGAFVMAGVMLFVSVGQIYFPIGLGLVVLVALRQR